MTKRQMRLGLPMRYLGGLVQSGQFMGYTESGQSRANQGTPRFACNPDLNHAQKASGYTKRARAEAAIGRFKQVIGDGLRSRTDRRRATEVNVAVHALNRMLELGRPISVRTA